MINIHWECPLQFYSRPGSDLAKSISSLTKEIMHTTQGQLEKTEPTIAAVAKELEAKPGRAFKHLITGKFLAESGTSTRFLEVLQSFAAFFISKLHNKP